MSNTNRPPAGRQKALAIVQVVIVLLFLALEIYQLARYGLSLTNAVLLGLWIICLFFVARNLLRTLKSARTGASAPVPPPPAAETAPEEAAAVQARSDRDE